MLRSSIPGSACALVVCFLLAGCGGSGVVSVSGTLTYKGKPVTNAFVNFMPENGRQSMGETDQDGRFTLTYDPQTKGAQVGKHKVFVTRNAAAEANQPGAVPGVTPKLSPDMGEFFSKYSHDKSKVEVTIDKATSDLKLEWDQWLHAGRKEALKRYGPHPVFRAAVSGRGSEHLDQPEPRQPHRGARCRDRQRSHDRGLAVVGAVLRDGPALEDAVRRTGLDEHVSTAPLFSESGEGSQLTSS